MSEHLQSIRKKVGHDLLVLPSVAVAVLDEYGRLLVGRHAQKNLWVPPGGIVEAGELPADAAIRETWEEMGVLVKLNALLGVYGGEELVIEYSNGDRTSYVNVLFSGRIIGGQLREDGEEILDVRYFTQEELTSSPHPRWMDTAMKSIFSQDGPAHFQPSKWSPA